MIKQEWKLFKKNHELFLLTLPGIVYKFIFFYLPLAGIVLAFKNYKYNLGIWGSEWVGFKNFEFFFVSDMAFRITRNTILYNLGYISLTTVISLVIAVLLNEISKNWLKLYQTVMLLPYFLSWVLVSYVSYAFLDQSHGYLNSLLQSMEIDPMKWYQDSRPWPYILNIAHLWKQIGFSALVYYAGIIGIDSDYYEAARIDGATRLQMVRKITIPLLTPLITVLLILSIGGIFRGDFGLHYFVTNNSSFIYPVTDVIDTYVYRALNTLGDIGMSSAVGLYQSFVGFILVLAANYIVKKMNHENSLW